MPNRLDTRRRNLISAAEKHGMGAGWVFYERLKESEEDSWKNKIYEIINSDINSFQKINYSEEKEAKDLLINLEKIARNELKKEIALMQDVFNVKDLNLKDWDTEVKNAKEKGSFSSRFWLNFIRGYNDIANGRDIYARNLNRILADDQAARDKDPTKKGTIAKNTIAEFFPGYFKARWRYYFTYNKKVQDDITKEVESITEGVSEKQIKINIAKIIDNAYEKAIKATIKGWLNSSDFQNGVMIRGQENGLQDTQAYKQVYEWLLTLEKDIDLNNNFVKAIYNTYELDELKKIIEDILKETKITKGISASLSKQIADKVKLQQTGYEKGEMSEELLTIISEHMLNDALPSGSIYNAVVKRVGSSGAKPDIIWSFSFPEDHKSITNKIDNAYKTVIRLSKDEQNINSSNRLKNMEKQKELAEALTNTKGFMIYVNAKDYTIFDGFRGYHAGSPISLNTYQAILKKTKYPENWIRKIIGAVRQTLNGAIGGESFKRSQKIHSHIALTIATFLFDDVDTIGDEMSNGTNHVHLFNLNGIYLPLSLILYLLYFSFIKSIKAIKEGNSGVSSTMKINRGNLVTVKISGLENIKYKSDSEYEVNWWNIQKDEAMRDITVTIDFLRGIKEILDMFADYQ